MLNVTYDEVWCFRVLLAWFPAKEQGVEEACGCEWLRVLKSGGVLDSFSLKGFFEFRKFFIFLLERVYIFLSICGQTFEVGGSRKKVKNLHFCWLWEVGVD